MTDDERRKGYLMMSTLSRSLTDAEREELVGLLTPKPTDSETESETT